VVIVTKLHEADHSHNHNHNEVFV